jgi:hypothetical protein
MTIERDFEMEINQEIENIGFAWAFFQKTMKQIKGKK